MSQTVSLDVVAAAERAAPVVRARAEETEHARRLPPDLVVELAGAGLLRMAVPHAYGGPEASAADLLRAIEIVSEADGATGWCVMIGSTTSALAAFLPEDAAAEIYGDPHAVTGGVYAPLGRARVVDGGYRVTGRWPFASGSQHCSWLTGGCVIEGGVIEGAVVEADGRAPRLLFFPAADVEIVDTWYVSGLAGTGSNDMAVADAFVPTGREVTMGLDGPRVSGTLYSFPIFGLLALGIGAVALGLARAAVDELRALAGGKTPTGTSRTLAERAVVQAEVSRAVAGLRAARALFYGSVAEAWEAAADGASMTVDHRVALRMAATHAVATAADVVDVMYRSAGGTSVYLTSPLQRQFRDVHVVTQHVMVAPATWELSGRLLLGVPTDTTLL